jgi:hypothetical protein
MQLVLGLCLSVLAHLPEAPTTLSGISKDHAIYIEAASGDVLTIESDHRMGSDRDLLYVFGPTGRLERRLDLTGSKRAQIALRSGSGSYKIVPVDHTYIHSFSIEGPRGMVVEPLAHEELIRITNSGELFFHVPADTDSMTFHAHSMWSAGRIREELYDPRGQLVHTFDLPRHTYEANYVVDAPLPGAWSCRFVTKGYDRCGAWLEGVPNLFSSTPSSWFEPVSIDAEAKLDANANEVVSDGARVGVNWWLNPSYAPHYELERAAVVDGAMDTARISVRWSAREPENDNSDPNEIDWQGFDFRGHDQLTAAYYEDIVSAIPDAMPVLMFYWDPGVAWQSQNPSVWSPLQREEYAEFVLATMIHTVAPDLQSPPSSKRAYAFHYVELLNEPNLDMGSDAYEQYIELVKSVGRRLRSHPDPRINSLKIVAPGIGGVWGESDREMENWIGRLLDKADAFVDGVNWHQYGYIRLEEGTRYAEDVAKVQRWLRTRGDGVADEELLMTETNQHGGPPTCWQRQDTFHAALWWAGSTFSALRAGVRFLHFYKLVDDPPGTHNWKGMLFNQGPYDPPVFPGGAPFGRKPIFDAAAFVNTRRLEEVISSSCDHAELSHLVTMSRDHTRITVFLANLFDRKIRTTVSLTLPEGAEATRYSMTMSAIDATGTWNAEKGRGTSCEPPLAVLRQTLTLEARTIYALEYGADN